MVLARPLGSFSLSGPLVILFDSSLLALCSAYRVFPLIWGSSSSKACVSQRRSHRHCRIAAGWGSTQRGRSRRNLSCFFLPVQFSFLFPSSSVGNFGPLSLIVDLNDSRHASQLTVRREDFETNLRGRESSRRTKSKQDAST